MQRYAELEDLVGEEVGSVGFVRDYVEINFDGPILRSLSAPTVTAGSAEFTFPWPGSRDALCELIGRTLLSVQDTATGIVLVFPAARLEIPKADPGAGPEVAQFVPFADGHLQVAQMKTWENQLH